jgi:hypothetical protein
VVEKFQASERVIGRLLQGEAKAGGDPEVDPYIRLHRGARGDEEAGLEEAVAGEPESYAPRAVGLNLYMQDYTTHCHTRSRYLRWRG